MKWYIFSPDILMCQWIIGNVLIYFTKWMQEGYRLKRHPCAQHGFNSYRLPDDLNSSKVILRDRVVWNHLISEMTCFQGRSSLSCAIIKSVSNRNYFHFVILNAVKDLENVSWCIRDASLRSAWHCFLIVVFYFNTPSTETVWEG